MTENVAMHEYLKVINDLEDGLVELDPKEMGIVFSGLKAKVDGYVSLLQYMKERSGSLKERSKTLAQKAKYLENSYERIREYLAYLLDINDTPEILGDVYKIKVKTSESVGIIEQPREDHRMKYPELIRQKLTYEWDKAAIKDVLKNSPNMLDFASLDTKITTTIGIRK